MIGTTALSALLASAALAPQEARPVPDRSWVHYELLAGSTLTDLHDLGPADPVHPIEGSFFLRRLPTASPFDTFELRRVRFHTADPPAVAIRGSGFYLSIGQYPGGSQEMNLVVDVDSSAGVVLSSGVVPLEAPFRTIEIELLETSATNEHLYALHLIAEPPHPMGFSTEVGLTSNRLGPVSSGDFLSSRGRILRTNSELTQLLGILPPAPDVGLDALGLTPATTSVLFSSEVDVFSESQGAIGHGDLLNEHGFIGLTNQELTLAFDPAPGTPDAGLDALHVELASGELWFSLEEPLLSQTLGVLLHPGDLLSSAGYIVKTNAQLLARFDIVDPDPAGYGLDAVTRRPNGAILFSVEEGFLDARLGPVGHGDVLSDSGHLVHRNLDLVWPFEPLEDVNDFGLDALEIGAN